MGKWLLLSFSLDQLQFDLFLSNDQTYLIFQVSIIKSIPETDKSIKGKWVYINLPYIPVVGPFILRPLT